MLETHSPVVSAGDRFAAVPLDEPGTPVEEWERAAEDLPALEVAGWRHVVAVVAHPDDEILGLGRLLAQLADRDVVVEVLIASMGEGACLDAEAAVRGGLGLTRQLESEQAATVLGLPAPRFLGLPDGRLSEYESAISSAITDAVGAAPSSEVVVLAHWELDGHPDHEAVGRAARRAVEQARTDDATIRLLRFPVWALHWDRPVAGLIPMERGLRVPDDLEPLARKRAAVAHFVSQTSPWPAGASRMPVLPPHVVHRLVERTEFVIDEDSGDSREPVDSRAHLAELYEGAEDPWNLEASAYEVGKRRATLEALPREHYECCFEPGCSIGMLTLELATRAARVEAWEPVERPLARARSRVAAFEAVGAMEPGRIRLSQKALTADPSGPQFGPAGADLIVLSEVLYYLPHVELTPILSAIVERAAPGAHVVAVHWRHPVAGWPDGGAGTHEALHALPGLRHLRRNDQDPDYLIDVFEVR